jgi:hypothetical protein
VYVRIGGCIGNLLQETLREFELPTENSFVGKHNTYEIGPLVLIAWCDMSLDWQQNKDNKSIGAFMGR